MGNPARGVTLRLLEAEDADVIAEWGTDPQFCRDADWSPDLSFAERQRAQRGHIQSPPSDLIRLGAACEGALIGYVDLHGDEPVRRELGFLVGGRDRWGRGFGRLVAAAGLGYGFGRLGLHQIWAEALDANHRSVNILRSLGLEETGNGAEGVFNTRPSYYRQFAITADAWARTRTSGSAATSASTCVFPLSPRCWPFVSLTPDRP